MVLGLAVVGFMYGQQKTPGKVITEFGATYTVNNPDFKTNTEHNFKVVFDVGRSFEDATKVNPLLETAARFINMHAAAGVPLQHIKVALVVHGNAANDLLNDNAYAVQHGGSNPNTPLLKALAEQNVQLILCGQTANYRKLTKEQLVPDIRIALSAMTALVQLQNDGYRLIHF
ncbi:intracellular sulfur oxidation DsrE/DsrF family protein [Aquimarina brevivitae]|uniref:Intracellular sulfur oxidation DsrE/DsrF family protein n=1 Tax=Aquimarina brevivitae TaxID=323412 RepID=A0A4Q7P2W9_9FLAO|nr:intracellular sulfur oxidation DsrE/DsrF family protein [Aquimarina brevivitae]